MAESLKPLYLFSGDSFLTEQKFETAAETIKKNVKGEVHIQSFHLTDTGIDTVLAQARNLPFLAQAQVFRLQDAETLKEKMLEPLERYLEKPSAFSFLIFESATMEKKHPLVKLAMARGHVEFMESAAAKTASGAFIREKFRRAGKTLAAGVLQSLEDQAGDSPSFLDSVIDQIILYSGDKSEITGDMVEQFEENWKSTDVFSLTDAILSGKPGRAMKLLKEILEENDKDLIPLLGLLHWQIRRFWQARVLHDEGNPESVILKKCKVSPRQAPFFMRQLKALPRKKLEQCLEGLFQMDWKIKTGRAEGPLALETWVVQATA